MTPTTTLRSGLSLSLVPVDDPDWCDYVAQSPDATTCHLPVWARTLALAYRYPAYAVVLRDRRGTVRGGLPVLRVAHVRRPPRWVSLPFTDRCPPLLDRDVAPEDLVTLLDRARRDLLPGSVEVRAELPGDLARPAAPAWYHRIDLDRGLEEVVAGFHPSQVRRNVARARRDGAEVRVLTAESDLTETFYGLHVLTRRRLGVPVQPRRYFALLWQHVIRPGHGHLLVAFVTDRPAAAAVFLTHGSTTVYKYGASDPELRRTRANHLLFDEAVRHAVAEGHRTFDFGRTDLADQSLREFKSRWGAVETREVCSVVGREAEPGARQVPGLARRLLRSSPPQLTRWTGQALYRWTA
jgi:CelD/BcsL family acetyltransferase involved in cellulose biosynthesis